MTSPTSSMTLLTAGSRPGWCVLLLLLLALRPASAATYGLHSASGDTLTPGTYTTSWANSRVHCAIDAMDAHAPGYGVRDGGGGGGVECFVSTAAITTESAATGDSMVIFKQVAVLHPPTPRSLVGGGLDGATTGTMVFLQHPFPSAGRVARAEIRALRTTGTLLLGVYRRTSGGAGTCGGFSRVQEVAVTRTVEGIGEWEFGASELRFEAGDYYGIVWFGAGGGIIPFDGGEALCYEASSAASVATGSGYNRNYHINFYVAFD